MFTLVLLEGGGRRSRALCLFNIWNKRQTDASRANR